MGKLLEWLLKTRTQNHLSQQPNCISEQQYRFTRGRSAVQAIERVTSIVERTGTGQLYNHKLCTLVSLDVTNAFNTTPWEKIDAALIQKMRPDYITGVIRSYFDQRCIIIEEERHTVTAGVSDWTGTVEYFL